jgi:phospholipid transport system transporter-binding protein
LRDRDGEPAAFEVLMGERSRILGALEFATVTALLPLGSDAISRGQAAVIDLSGVTHSDSSGLALLIEWLSVATSTERPLRFENIPLQLHQLARLSEVDTLIGCG